MNTIQISDFKKRLNTISKLCDCDLSLNFIYLDFDKYEPCVNYIDHAHYEFKLPNTTTKLMSIEDAEYILDRFCLELHQCFCLSNSFYARKLFTFKSSREYKRDYIQRLKNNENITLIDTKSVSGVVFTEDYDGYKYLLIDLREFYKNDLISFFEIVSDIELELAA